ncbi:hypothetical protein COOONC_21808 [Cooperia oncophora]
MSPYGDRMNILQRFENMISSVLGEIFFRNLFEAETKAFRAKFGPHFKGYQELLAEVSYAFINSNPYLDFPRPMLHKTVPIGGITVNIDPKKNILSEEWDSILNLRNSTVLVSFGSMAKSVLMPDEYKYVAIFKSQQECNTLI